MINHSYLAIIVTDTVHDKYHLVRVICPVPDFPSPAVHVKYLVLELQVTLVFHVVLVK